MTYTVSSGTLNPTQLNSTMPHSVKLYVTCCSLSDTETTGAAEAALTAWLCQIENITLCVISVLVVCDTLKTKRTGALLNYQWCSSRDSSLGLETLVLMSWSWDTKSQSWSHLGPFKPWLFVSEVHNHVWYYQFFWKRVTFPKKAHLGVSEYICGATIVFLLSVAIRDIK